MTAAGARHLAGQAPGVVKIRLSGGAEDIEAVGRLLDIGAAAVGFLDLIEISQPYPTRRDAGERVYLTIRITHARQRQACAQPPSRSPAPRSLKGGPSHDDH